MAVTDMVTNAVKYAYPSSEGGDIWVTTACLENWLSVTVADTGVGFEQAAGRSGGMGVRLVKFFAIQPNSELAIRHDQGTTIEIIVPMPDDAGREPNSHPGVSVPYLKRFRGVDCKRCRSLSAIEIVAGRTSVVVFYQLN